ncbi:MAG: GNAT family N-acetyltransferase [Pseudomonadota bacterium]
MPDFLLTDCATPETWRPHLTAGTLWVVEADGERVGYLAARVDEDRLHIDELDVERAFQGRGIGRRLLAAAADWARANQLPRLSLTTFRAIPWNGPFYASFGFRECEGAATPDALRTLLAHEAELGLPDRCAMLMDL